jgi:hypothetical protein
VALREVRGFLDKHQNHSFEKIIFAAYSTIEEKAFIDFLPVFFPPTHGDIENSRPTGSSRDSRSHAHLQTQLLQVHDQVETAVRELTAFVEHIVDFPSGNGALDELAAIMSVLRSLEELLSRPKEIIKPLSSQVLAEVKHLNNVIHAVCSNIAEITELGKGKANSGQPSYQAIWENYNSHMKTQQGLGLIQLLELCQNFAQCLEDILVRLARCTTA